MKIIATFYLEQLSDALIKWVIKEQKSDQFLWFLAMQVDNESPLPGILLMCCNGKGKALAEYHFCFAYSQRLLGSTFVMLVSIKRKNC